MHKYIKYFKYVVRHKWYVLKAGLKLKAPLWNLIVHDLTKFLPSEFFPYAEWFYGWNGKSWHDAPSLKQEDFDKGGMIIVLHAETGLEFKEHNKLCFDYAWNLHQKRNPHHYQYWVVLNDKGDMKCLEMPEKYVREMVADWIGAGMAISGKNDVLAWYKKNRDAIKLHHRTRELVCKLIGFEVENG